MQNFLQKIKASMDLKKIGLIAAAIILLLLAMDLNRRLNELSRLTAQRDKVATSVAELESTYDMLSTQVEFARSDGAVEEWAYTEGKMVRPGEVLVIPLSPPGTTPQPVVIPTQIAPPVQNWEVWFALIVSR